MDKDDGHGTLPYCSAIGYNGYITNTERGGQ